MSSTIMKPLSMTEIKCIPCWDLTTFTSMEYMPDTTDTTPTGWLKDYILTDEILKCLDSTEEQDYIYTVSVQGHGDYPEEPMLTNPLIRVTGAQRREKNNYAWEYYCNQIHEMDEFLRELTEALKDYPEPVILVMYGDHLPTMGLQTVDLENRYLFQTEYVIWDNMGLPVEDGNLSAYQIGAKVLDMAGIHEGTMIRYHQARRNSRNYQRDLEVLQYDILYGEQYVYGGENPYGPADMPAGDGAGGAGKNSGVSGSNVLFHRRKFYSCQPGGGRRSNSGTYCACQPVPADGAGSGTEGRGERPGGADGGRPERRDPVRL